MKHDCQEHSLFAEKSCDVKLEATKSLHHQYPFWYIHVRKYYASVKKWVAAVYPDAEKLLRYIIKWRKQDKEQCIQYATACINIKYIVCVCVCVCV